MKIITYLCIMKGNEYYKPTLEEIVPGVTIYIKHYESPDYAECTLETQDDVDWAMEQFMNVTEDYGTRIYSVPNVVKMKR